MPPKREPFSDWVQKPDCEGRLGWEKPNIPEWKRWWAHWTFEDLPTGENLKTGKAKQETRKE